MATNTPWQGSTRSGSPPDFSRRPVTSVVPRISVTMVSGKNRRFGDSSIRRHRAFSARRAVPRWMSQTVLHRGARYRASLTALLPPPMTQTVLFRKKKPSHRAHQLTPRPVRAASPGMFSFLGAAPQARIRAFPKKDWPPARTSFVSPRRENSSACAVSTVTPASWAIWSILPASSGPPGSPVSPG